MEKPEENIEFKRYKPTSLVTSILKLINAKLINKKEKINSDNYYEIMKKVYEIDELEQNI
tara:strand:- start:144 stop:323 length:180 start_codon:yes stop_codon:yes gene_type:complete